MSIGLSAVLRMVDGKPGHLMLWCPACDCSHCIDIHALSRNGHVTGWNGSFNRPSFGEPVRFEKSEVICEFLVEGGVIRYLESCGHILRGKSVPLPAFPEVHK